jgi:DNA repair exonuclease SbcCD ATPase subunit
MLGTCKDCALEWPGCGAIHGTINLTYGVVTGCASHFQPREERSEDTRPEPAAEEQPRNWVTRELESMREMFVKDTRPAPAAPVEKDERVEIVRRWRDNIHDPAINHRKAVEILDGILAVVGEMKEKCDEWDKANSPKYHGHGYSLQEELDYLRAENEGVKEHHNSARAERDEYFAERNKFAAESSRLQNECDRLNAKLSRLNVALEDHVGCGGVCELAALERNVSARLRAEVDGLTAKRDKYKGQRDKLSEKVERQRERIRVLEGPTNHAGGLRHDTVDERVERAERWMETNGPNLPGAGRAATAFYSVRPIIRDLLAVVGEMREKIKEYERLYTTRVTELEKLVEKSTVERDYAVNELDMFGYKLTELEQERDAALERVKELEDEARNAKDLISAAMDVLRRD